MSKSQVQNSEFQDLWHEIMKRSPVIYLGYIFSPFPTSSAHFSLCKVFDLFLKGVESTVYMQLIAPNINMRLAKHQL